MRSIIAAAAASVATAQTPKQVQIHPTGKQAAFSVDFVGVPGALSGKVQFGAHGEVATVPTTSFVYPNIGAMHQATFDFSRFGVSADEPGWYRVSADGATWSANFSVTPFVATYRSAIFGDFGIANDVVMDQLARELAAGSYDAVQHVGDFACVRARESSTLSHSLPCEPPSPLTPPFHSPPHAQLRLRGAELRDGQLLPGDGVRELCRARSRERGARKSCVLCAPSRGSARHRGTVLRPSATPLRTAPPSSQTRRAAVAPMCPLSANSPAAISRSAWTTRDLYHSNARVLNPNRPQSAQPEKVPCAL